MLENENDRQVTWDMPSYGVCTFEPSSSIEQIAVELVQLQLYLQNNNLEKKFDAHIPAKVLEQKLKDLTTAVLESKIKNPEKKPRLILYVPEEIVIESYAVGNLHKNQ